MAKRAGQAALIEMTRLRPEEAAALAELARTTGRSEEDLAHEALAEYLAAQRWRVEAIKKGMAEADAGLVVSDDEMRAWAESLGTEEQRPLPRAGRPG